MADEENECIDSSKIVQLYADFMTRVSTFEELSSAGNMMLISFQQALGILGRPPISKTSVLVDQIIRSHGSKRLLSYVEGGCMNTHDSAQHVSKLHTCHRGLQDHVNEAKTVIDELRCLVDAAASVVRATNAEDTYFSSDFNLSITSCDVEELPLPNLSSKVTDYASMMAIVYGMVKQDYTMQAQIISSQNLKTSPE